MHLKTYLQDQLILDNEAERAKIYLANDREFYPVYHFKEFLVQEGDGFATAESLYKFCWETLIEKRNDCQKRLTEMKGSGICTFDEFKAFVIHFAGENKINFEKFFSMINPKSGDFTDLMLGRS